MGRQESEIEYPFLHSKGLVLGELATNFGMMVLKEEMLKLRNGFHIGRYVCWFENPNTFIIYV